MGTESRQAVEIRRIDRQSFDGPRPVPIFSRLLIMWFILLYSSGYAIAAETEADAGEMAQVLHWNPFNKPTPVAVKAVSPQPPVEQTPPWEPELRATLVGGARPSANIDGWLILLGDEVEGFKLVEIRERRAVLEKDGVRRILTMDSKQPHKRIR